MSMNQTMCEFVHGMTCKEVCEFVGNIVRCRDCRFVKTCDVHNQMRLEFGNESADNGFCAWSEREEK